MTAPASFRRYYLVFVAVEGQMAPQLVLRTRSGSAAIAAAEPIGGWVEGDDNLHVWPCSSYEGVGWYSANERRWGER